MRAPASSCCAPKPFAYMTPKCDSMLASSGLDQPRRVVLRYTLAIGVHEPKVQLSIGVSLVGHLSKPPCRSSVIVRDTLTPVVNEREIELSAGVSLIGRFARLPLRARPLLSDG
jgi:hypothetical protein